MNALTDTFSNQDGSTRDLKIKIIGVGGAGTNAVDGLKLDDLGDVRLAAINTDVQALNQSPLAEKLVIGRSITRGLGSGGELEIGKKAAQSDRGALARMIADMDLIILIVGLGGGTGSAASLVLAEVAAKTDALILVFATLPFSFEGSRRKEIAQECAGELRQIVHGFIPLPNDVLLQEEEEDTSVLNAFALADRWIGRGVNSLCAMLLKTGLINQDFSSLSSVFKNRGGKTIFGTSAADGRNYVQDALEELFICPLLHLGDRPAHLDHILVNVIGGADLSISKVNEIMMKVSKRFGSREDIIFGAVIDESRNQSLELCILGKANMEEVSRSEPKQTPSRIVENRLEIETQIQQDISVQRPVHRSKLSEKSKLKADQNEFMFIEDVAQRGYFDKTDRNEYNGEDLDVPTYMRRGIKIKIK